MAEEGANLDLAHFSIDFCILEENASQDVNYTL